MQRGWMEHERYANELLGLSPTVHSGARWHDVGDGVDRSHPSQNDFALVADCKYTEKFSYSVKLKDLLAWREKAFEMGKRFIMPIRLWPRGDGPSDYVLLTLDDFAELLEKTKPAEYWGGPG